MVNFTWEQIVKITEDYNDLDTALYGLAKILQELGYEKFSGYVNYSFLPRWFVNEILTLDPKNKTIEVEFRASLGEHEDTITVKIPLLWLQMEDPREEIRFHMELAN